MNETTLETFEITGPQMVMTMKLTTFAWNVFDGRRPVEVLHLSLIPALLLRLTYLGFGQVATPEARY